MKRVSAFVVAFAFVAVAARAERLLIKNGGEYLGARTSSSLFTTCHGGKIRIGDGTIVDTDDRCSESIVGPITGSIGKLARELVVNDSHGNEVIFELTSDEYNRLLREFDAGTTVKVTVEDGERRIERN
jgi:hypothetical protein